MAVLDPDSVEGFLCSCLHQDWDLDFSEWEDAVLATALKYEYDERCVVVKSIDLLIAKLEKIEFEKKRIETLYKLEFNVDIEYLEINSIEFLEKIKRIISKSAY